jgi:hypothetical protein
VTCETPVASAPMSLSSTSTTPWRGQSRLRQSLPMLGGGQSFQLRSLPRSRLLPHRGPPTITPSVTRRRQGRRGPRRGHSLRRRASRGSHRRSGRSARVWRPVTASPPTCRWQRAAKAAVGCSYGCKPLPKPDVKPKGPGDCECHHVSPPIGECLFNHTGAWLFNHAGNFNGVWALHTNGTITSVMDGNCLQTSTKGGAVNVGICTGGADQKFKWQVVNAKPKGHPGPLYTVTQVVAGVELCVQQSA